MARKTLSMVESAKVINAIESEFVARCETDSQFAKYLTEKLGFEVNDMMVFNRRTELGIPSHRPIQSLQASSERVEALERQFAANYKDAQALTAVVLEIKARVAALEKAFGPKQHFSA